MKTRELAFQPHYMLAVSSVPGVRVWRQNVGQIPVRSPQGKLLYFFDPGPPVGAADLTGFVSPFGFRLEIELKADGGKRSPEQVNHARVMQEAGCVYVLFTYRDAETLKENMARGVRELVQAIEARRMGVAA